MKTPTSEKVIRISLWYLILQSLFHTVGFIACFFLLLIIGLMNGLSDQVALRVSFVGAALTSLTFFSNVILYWRNSGIYITKHGDHVVKQGGWFVSEDKLLNGVIVVNQVTRNPIDQILGMASIQTGLFGDKSLSGVRYSDIEHYDTRMRSQMKESITSIF